MAIETLTRWAFLHMTFLGLHVLATEGPALQPQCKRYLELKRFGSPEVLQQHLRKCERNPEIQDQFAPKPQSPAPGVTDTSSLSCQYGHPTMNGPSEKTCCGWRPHFNWVVGTCDPNEKQKDSMFCKNMPECVHQHGAENCGARINYVASYQYNGSHFNMMDDSTVGRKSAEGVSGSAADQTGWEEEKEDFFWRHGDWTSKYAPWGDGPNGPRGGTPPAMMWVLSADSFYYGAFYMLSQLTLNLEGKDMPTHTNCWNWEIDPVEGTAGWVPPGSKLPGNMNQLYSTNNAAVSGCMPVTYSAVQANGGQREFQEPEMFREYCSANPTAAGCQPWEENVMWSGGVLGTQRFENYANQPYVFAVVVDHRGYWIYRWIPDGEGHTGWSGLDRNQAARTLGPRPRPIRDPKGLQTDVGGGVPEAVILQPSVPPEAACLRSSIEAVNFQFGSDALGAMAEQLGENHPGGKLEGAQNWWSSFADSGQYQNYPLSIAGLPQTLSDQYDCNSPETFACDCRAKGARRLSESGNRTR